MARFDALIACYRSGQISERQWQAHLRDEPGLADHFDKQSRGRR
jgi:hypothetical protein